MASFDELVVEGSGGVIVRMLGKGSKNLWNEPGVGSGDVAALVGCAADPDDTVLVLWARIVSKYLLKEIKRVRKVTDLEQGSPDWLNWRKAGVGGSEVGCVVGANSYKGSQALDIWGRKLPTEHADAVGEVKDNYAMARGRRLEPAARQMYENLMGWEAPPVCVIHSQHDCARASLDGLRADEKVVLEVKCSGVANHTKYVRISRIEDAFERQTEFARVFPAYRYQVLYQLLLTEAEVAHFVAYNPDMPDPADQFATFRLYPEPAEQERLLQRVLEFWSYVETKTPPPLTWVEPCWKLPDIDDLKVPEGVV